MFENINFGNAKPLPPVTDFPEGNYTVTVESWEPKEANKEESRAKGYNIAVVFSIDELDGAPKFYHNVWVQYDNPFALKHLISSLLNRDIEDDENLPVTDGDVWVGEQCGAMLVHESYTDKNDKKRYKWGVDSFDSFYALGN